MKKIYITPSMQIIDAETEAIMVCASCQIKENSNGFTIDTQDITGTAESGDMDAASFRSNLWD